ncbi:MAG: TIGR03067 domain-containing protein [Bacteroidetes bacterium]|nr:TIGR03067 domain-containing protein [Bacteroidota bacterium]
MSLEGIWEPTEAVLEGNQLPEDFLYSLIFKVEGTNFSIKIGGDVDAGTIKYIPHAIPQALELSSTEGAHKGKIIPAIYKLTGNYLTVSINIHGSTRPTSFISTPENKLFTAKYTKKSS